MEVLLHREFKNLFFFLGKWISRFRATQDLFSLLLSVSYKHKICIFLLRSIFSIYFRPVIQFNMCKLYSVLMEFVWWCCSGHAVYMHQEDGTWAIFIESNMWNKNIHAFRFQLRIYYLWCFFRGCAGLDISWSLMPRRVHRPNQDGVRIVKHMNFWKKGCRETWGRSTRFKMLQVPCSTPTEGSSTSSSFPYNLLPTPYGRI